MIRPVHTQSFETIPRNHSRLVLGIYPHLGEAAINHLLAFDHVAQLGAEAKGRDNLGTFVAPDGGIVNIQQSPAAPSAEVPEGSTLYSLRVTETHNTDHMKGHAFIVPPSHRREDTPAEHPDEPTIRSLYATHGIPEQQVVGSVHNLRNFFGGSKRLDLVQNPVGTNVLRTVDEAKGEYTDAFLDAASAVGYAMLIGDTIQAKGKEYIDAWMGKNQHRLPNASGEYTVPRFMRLKPRHFEHAQRGALDHANQYLYEQLFS